VISGTDDILADHDSLRAGQEALCQDLHQHPELPHAIARACALIRRSLPHARSVRRRVRPPVLVVSVRWSRGVGRLTATVSAR
jgi:hypothetical protein